MPSASEPSPSVSGGGIHAASERPTGMGTQLHGLLRSMRPKQWTKNGFVLVGLIFDGKLLDPGLGLAAAIAFVAFCLVSSSVYLLNDLVDIESDRLHPRKRLRPLASGHLNPAVAKGALVFLAAVSVLGAGLYNSQIGLTVAAYLALNAAYTFYLKRLVIIDVLMIAVFFLLRVVAGLTAVDVSAFSPWLYICVSLLAFFVGFGKRRHEILLLKESASGHRSSLNKYNLPFLDQIIGLVTVSGLISYTLYSFEAETALAGPAQMMLTVPLIVFVVFRYFYLIHVEQRGGAPEDLLFSDRPLLAGVVLWLLSVVAVIYIW